jgi:hypothetical protein
MANSACASARGSCRLVRKMPSAGRVCRDQYLLTYPILVHKTIRAPKETGLLTFSGRTTSRCELTINGTGRSERFLAAR